MSDIKLPETFSAYNPPPVIKEEMVDEGLVETDGYIEMQDLIDTFLEAGNRLAEQRAYFYKDVESVNEEDQGGELLNKIDAVYAAKSTRDRITHFRAENERKAREAALEKAKADADELAALRAARDGNT